MQRIATLTYAGSNGGVHALEMKGCRRSVAVLFSNELMAAGLRHLMGHWRESDVRYFSLRDSTTVEKLLALRPDIIIVEAAQRELWEGKLLSVLSRGLLVSIDLDRNTLNCYYVRRNVPATVQELIEAMGQMPERFCQPQVAVTEAQAAG